MEPSEEADDERPGEGVVAVSEATRARSDDRDLLVAALVLVVAAALLDVTPARDGVTLLGWRLPEACGLKRATGWPCPGCGLTRSVILAAHGQLEAFRLHAVGPILFVLAALQVPYRAWRLARGAPRARLGAVRGRVLAALVAAIGLHWLWALARHAAS